MVDLSGQSEIIFAQPQTQMPVQRTQPRTSGGMITVVRRLDGIDTSRLVNLSVNENAWGTAPGAVRRRRPQRAALYADTGLTLRGDQLPRAGPACIVPGRRS